MSCCQGNEPKDYVRSSMRVCTDLPCLILFLLLFVVMICTAIFACILGNPKRLVHGYDSFGNICGDENLVKIGNGKMTGRDLSNKPYVFYLDSANTNQSLQICVESCPSRQLSNMKELQTYYKKTKVNFCWYEYDPISNYSSDSLHQLSEADLATARGPCPKFPIRQSEPFLNRCVSPNFTSSLKSVIKSWDLAEQILMDVYSVWIPTVVLCVLALVISLVIIAMFALCSSYCGYIILIGSTLSTVGSVWALWWSYYRVKSSSNLMSTFLEQTINNSTTLMVCSIIATMIAIVIFLLIIYSAPKVTYFAHVLKECDAKLKRLPGLYLLPVASFVLLMIFYAFWIFIIVYLASARYPGAEDIRILSDDSLNASRYDKIELDNGYNVSEDNPLNITWGTVSPYKKAFTRVEFVEGAWAHYMWWLYIFGLIWISEFMLGCQQMITAGAVAYAYFQGHITSEQTQAINVPFPVRTSAKLMVLYHLGSVAFGSISITFLKVPRIIMNYVQKMISRRRPATAGWCFEKFCRYVHHNAYTVVVLRGIGFYFAAERAFIIMAQPLETENWRKLRNCIETGDILFFLSKALVTSVTGLVGWFLLSTDPNVQFVAIPTLIVCIFAFFIAHCVISTYEVVIDTIFLCLREDKDISGENGKWKEYTLVKANWSDEEETSRINS